MSKYGLCQGPILFAMLLTEACNHAITLHVYAMQLHDCILIGFGTSKVVPASHGANQACPFTVCNHAMQFEQKVSNTSVVKASLQCVQIEMDLCAHFA